jgi:hypothetical protein
MVALVAGSLLEQGLAVEQDSQGVGASPAGPSKMRMEGNFQAPFSRRKSIGFPKPCRLTSGFFLCYLNTLIRIFDGNVSCPGLYGGSYEYGQNLSYKFKKLYGNFQNRNFEKLHRTTGPRLDLRPDL